MPYLLPRMLSEAHDTTDRTAITAPYPVGEGGMQPKGLLAKEMKVSHYYGKPTYCATVRGGLSSKYYDLNKSQKKRVRRDEREFLHHYGSPYKFK